MFWSYFNPRPPRGGRPPRPCRAAAGSAKFQSTPPARGATLPERCVQPCRIISIHAPREGGDCDKAVLAHDVAISIHAPREGGDARQPFRLRVCSAISIHAPREGGDVCRNDAYNRAESFQSTPPARGATGAAQSGQQARQISIHAPREGGDPRPVVVDADKSISIHAPREGGDTARFTPASRIFSNFNPRPPRGGRLFGLLCEQRYIPISIHAPREGGDRLRAVLVRLVFISIHAPREGGDSLSNVASPSKIDFNPRPPRGGRRVEVVLCRQVAAISIHAPREGGDAVADFAERGVHISIHAPREGGDLCNHDRAGVQIISIHAPREGGDLSSSGTLTDRRDFNPRPPRGGRRSR